MPTPTPSPLADADTHNMWLPVPFGVTPHGPRSGPYALPLTLEAHLLIGGGAGTGRTNALRQVIAGAALDPDARLVVWDAKDSRDHEMWTPVCAAYGAGTGPESVARLMGALADLCGEMRRRYQAMRHMDSEDCPEATVTPALTRDPARAMPLTLVAIDGVDRYLADPIHGGANLEFLSRLARTGLAAGIVLALTVDSAPPLPTDLRDPIGVRFATRTPPGHTAYVLGTGPARVDPATIPARDRGLGVLVGASNTGAAALVRTHLLDDTTTAELARRAVALRGVLL